jgi:hypothetical protein
MRVRRPGAVGVVTFVVVFAVVAVAGQLAVGMRASNTSEITGDEPFYLLTTQSLLSDGDLDLRDEYANGEDRRFWRGTVPLWKQMSPLPDGRLLSPHDPGLSVLVLPAYDGWGLRGAQRLVVLVWAAAMAVAAVVALRFGAPPWAAALGSVVVGAATPGVVYASQLYPEGPAAACVALGLHLVCRGNKSRFPRLIASACWFAGTLTALAWLGVKYVPLGAVLGLAWARRHRAREQRAALVTAGALLVVSGAFYVWWHFHTFEGLTPYATNVVYSGEGSATVLRQHVELVDRSYRLYGLFIDARFGLLRWLPVAALALWGVSRRHRTLLPTAVFAVGVVMGTFVSITMMGWWFPGRMLIAGFPALAVLVALGAARLPRTAIVLSAWSVAIAVALVWSARTGGVRIAVDPFALGFPLAPAWLFPDFRSFGAREIALSASWLAGLLALRWKVVRIT